MSAMKFVVIFLVLASASARLVESNWWSKFDSRNGRGDVPAGNGLKQLYRNKCNEFSCIEAAKSSKVPGGTKWAGMKNWHGKSGYHCPQNAVVVGFWRGDSDKNSILDSRLLCGKINTDKAVMSNCRTEDWGTYFDSKGWKGCSHGKYLTGFGGNRNDVGCSGIQCFETARCCSIRSRKKCSSSPGHGLKKCSNTSHGATCYTSCTSGYTAQSTSSMRYECNDGRWKAKTSQVYCRRDCKKGWSPGHNLMRCSGRYGVAHGAKCYLSCKAGYMPERQYAWEKANRNTSFPSQSANSYRCSKGTWTLTSSHRVKCVKSPSRKCGVWKKRGFKAVDGRKISHTITNTDAGRVDHGITSVVGVRCRKGYKLEPSTSGTPALTCFNDKWRWRYGNKAACVPQGAPMLHRYTDGWDFYYSTSPDSGDVPKGFKFQKTLGQCLSRTKGSRKDLVCLRHHYHNAQGKHGWADHFYSLDDKWGSRIKGYSGDDISVSCCLSKRPFKGSVRLNMYLVNGGEQYLSVGPLRHGMKRAKWLPTLGFLKNADETS